MIIETQFRSTDRVVCAPWGDLDWSGATSLRHVLADVLRPGMQVDIDLGHVDFFDAVGISALIGSSRRAQSMGCRVRIGNATPDLDRRLQRFGLHWVLSGRNEADDDVGVDLFRRHVPATTGA